MAERGIPTLYSAAPSSAQTIYQLSGEWPHKSIGDQVPRIWSKNLLENHASKDEDCIPGPWSGYESLSQSNSGSREERIRAQDVAVLETRAAEADKAEATAAQQLERIKEEVATYLDKNYQPKTRRYQLARAKMVQHLRYKRAITSVAREDEPIPDYVKVALNSLQAACQVDGYALREAKETLAVVRTEFDKIKRKLDRRMAAREADNKYESDLYKERLGFLTMVKGGDVAISRLRAEECDAIKAALQ
ncbi:hypothetical protein ACLX1H_011275 [Fusarium chlamydosporum]